MNTTGRLVEFSRLPISTQGQVTLPKAIRERLGVKAGGSGRITILVRTDGLIVIEPEPTVDDLFGILKSATPVKPANVNEIREELINERIRDLGYSPQTN